MNNFLFYYGKIFSGKTTTAINKAYELKSQGKNIYVYLPDVVWAPNIVSHNGDQYPVSPELLGDEHLHFIPYDSFVIIDEAHFLPIETINVLKNLTDSNQCKVFCFGRLKQKLLKVADRIIEVANTKKRFDTNETPI